MYCFQKACKTLTYTTVHSQGYVCMRDSCNSNDVCNEHPTLDQVVLHPNESQSYIHKNASPNGNTPITWFTYMHKTKRQTLWYENKTWLFISVWGVVLIYCTMQIKNGHIYTHVFKQYISTHFTPSHIMNTAQLNNPCVDFCWCTISSEHVG